MPTSSHGEAWDEDDAHPAPGGKVVSGTFSDDRVVVIGAGVAGIAAARALAQEGASVVITEARPRAQLGDLHAVEALGVKVLAGGHDPSHLDGATLVVTSPGIPPSAEVRRWALERDLRVWGELELGARLVRVPYLAVTGTNGKTTTSGMIAACLRAGGLDAVACGNIGRPFPTAALEHHDVLVVEASSFQLADQESLHPRVSVLLNLAPDHLDWHGSFEAYVGAKRRIYARQTAAGDVHVGDRDDVLAASVSAEAPCRVVWFRSDDPGPNEVGYRDGTLVAMLNVPEELGRIDGERAGYRDDAAAAAAAALAFGVDAPAVRDGLAGFAPERHRGESVAEADRVRFLDNSKATNVHAAIAAIDGVRDAVLIAGGRAKGQDLSLLATRASRLAGVVAVGESADVITETFDGLVVVRRAGSIEEATEVAFELAPRPGVVLLAPACASWDQFHDYRERGERFAAAARSIARGVRLDG
jgi:UDP-N-acetylmuramoylalanine--D-glutamate ligase